MKRTFALALASVTALFMFVECGDDDTTVSCQKVCEKTKSCTPEAAGLDCTTLCKSSAQSPTSQLESCKNASAVAAAVNACLDKTCAEFSTCLSTASASCMTGAAGSGGAGGTGGAGGAGGSGTGGAGAGGTTGTTSCAACTKATACCKALGTAGSDCNNFSSTCESAAPAQKDSIVSVCNAVLTAGASSNAACK